MAEISLLQQVLDANKSYLDGAPRALDPSGTAFVVIACMDGRLTSLLDNALGLPGSRAVVIRNAGNRVTPQSHDLLRSVAAALYLKGASEIFLVGHTDCAMSRFSTAEVAESFRKAGVTRDAFGDEDLRTWFGALSGIESNIVDSAAALRSAPIMPAGAKVHGLLIDTKSGGLKLLVDGDTVPAAVRAAEPEAPKKPVHPEPARRKSPREPGPDRPVVPPPVPAARRPSPGGAVVIEGASEPTEREAPLNYVDAVIRLRNTFAAARKDPELMDAVTRLRILMETERNPMRIFSELQKLERTFSSRYPGLKPVLELLKDNLRTKKGSINFMEMMRRVLG